MYYVIQVPTGQENEFIRRIKFAIQDKDVLEDLFSPTEKRMRNLHGERIEVETRCFPGYLFAKTEHPQELFKALYFIEGYTKLLKDGDKASRSFMPLYPREEELLLHLIGQGHHVDISHIQLDEGKKVRVIDGPLYGLEGNIVKINLHKKTAVVTLSLASQAVDVTLGIDIIREMDDGTI